MRMEPKTRSTNFKICKALLSDSCCSFTFDVFTLNFSTHLASQNSKTEMNEINGRVKTEMDPGYFAVVINIKEKINITIGKTEAYQNTKKALKSNPQKNTLFSFNENVSGLKKRKPINIKTENNKIFNPINWL